MKKRMKLKYNYLSLKDKIFIIIILILTCVLMIFKYINIKVKPVIEMYANNETTRVSTMIINEAINEMNLSEEESLDFISTIKNKNDEIISVDFNTTNINKSLVLLNNKIYEELKRFESGKYEFYSEIFKKENNLYTIPMGIISNSALFSNISPKIPLKTRLVGNVVSNIKTEVNPYGINNSLIKIYVDVTITERLIMPISSNNVNVSVSVPLVIKVINGRVPNVYGGAYSVTSPLTESE